MTSKHTSIHRISSSHCGYAGPAGQPQGPWAAPTRSPRSDTFRPSHSAAHAWVPRGPNEKMDGSMDIHRYIYIYIHIYIYVYSWYGNSRYLEYQLLFKVYLFGNHVFILRLFKFMHTLYFFHRGVESGFHRKKHRHVWCTNHRSKLECLMQKTLGRIGPDTMQAPSIPFLRSLRTMRFNAP